MGKLMKEQMNAINATLAQTITDIQALRPTVEDMRYELTHIFGATDSASGSVASFSDGAGGVFAKSVKVNITPSQSGSGDPSPTNIRPISGYTQAVVTNTSANLYSTAFEQGNVSSSGTNSTSSLAKRLRSTTYNEIGTGTFKLIVQPPFEAFIRAYSTPEIAGYVSGESSTAWLSGYNEFTLTSAKYVRIVIRFYDDSNITPSDFDATRFFICSAVHNSQVDFPTTIYGGSLNLTTGELVVTLKKIKVADLTWSYSSTYASFRALNSDFDGKTPSGGQTSTQAYCTAYKIANPLTQAQMAAATNGIAIGSGVSAYQLLINDPTYNGDAAAFKTAMGDTEIVYELATPVTYQLTPKQLLQFTLDNNISANCGTVEVTYRLNLNTAIERLQGV